MKPLLPPVTPEVVRAMMTPTSKLYFYYWNQVAAAPGRWAQQVLESYQSTWQQVFRGVL